MNPLNNNKQDKVLIAGKDYPQTYREFVEMFPDNQSCTDFLYKLRWKDGFICPKCGALSETMASNTSTTCVSTLPSPNYSDSRNNF